jgi:hypothetical protein
MAVAVVALNLLAGCASTHTKGSTTAGATTTGTSISSSQTTTSNGIVTPFNQTRLVLSDCTAWVAPALFPGNTSPGKPPHGWNPAPTASTTTGVGMNGYHCNRISIGPYERGPVNGLIDSHNNADFPANCTMPDNPSLGIISSFWIDDATIGAYLNHTYNLPVYITKFQEVNDTSAPIAVHTWTWALAGQPASKVSVYDDQTSTKLPPAPERLFWSRNGGIEALDFTYDREGPAGVLGNRWATGTLAPPMLLASVAGGQYAGLGEWYPTTHASGAFTHYTDTQCQHPG